MNNKFFAILTVITTSIVLAMGKSACAEDGGVATSAAFSFNNNVITQGTVVSSSGRDGAVAWSYNIPNSTVISGNFANALGIVGVVHLTNIGSPQGANLEAERDNTQNIKIWQVDNIEINIPGSINIGTSVNGATLGVQFSLPN
jgi:hypothetical protein